MHKVLFVAVVLCACWLWQSAEAKFVVVDGDSLENNGERIRLQGIDAPEFLQKCYDAQGWKYRCGYEATKQLKKLMQKVTSCERLGKDRYGRTLMKCYDAKGESIGEQMVRDGFAVSYGDEYQKAEDEARAYKKGIWKGKFMRPELYRALQRERKAVNKK